MSDAIASPAAVNAPAATTGPRFLPLLLILFIGSGCSALIYEIVWFQLLEFTVGSSAVSIAVLLGTFMGGLCLGSLLLPRLVPARFHALRVYALLELGIGILGILITACLPFFDSLYASIAHGNQSGIFLRAVVCSCCLLPPTFLMGATLPAISRWIEASPRGMAWLGFFYGGNTVGAVAGCLLAGFVLLRSLPMNRVTLVAAAINVVVALLAFALSLASPYTPPVVPTSVSTKKSSASSFDAFGNGSIYLAIALSGMAALGGEVVWTRLLSLLLGPTVYTFSIILAVYLVGLAIGSSLGAMLTRNGLNARLALAWCQILSVAGIAWAAYAVAGALPNWPVDNMLAFSAAPRMQMDLARCAFALLLPTIFWGASFPLALAAVKARSGDPAGTVGRVYAANTVGAIVGALFFGLEAIRNWGTPTAQHIMIVLACFSSLIALFPAFVPSRQTSDRDLMAAVLRAGSSVIASLAVTLLALGILIGYKLDVVPWQLVAWGRAINNHLTDYGIRNVYVGEGMTSSVAVTSVNGRDLQFHVAGKVEASTLLTDMRLQYMLGHFPSLFHVQPDQPRNVLIVGCGAGVTAGTFALYPQGASAAQKDKARIVICEIEPLVPEVVATYFSRENNGIVSRDNDGRLLEKRVNLVFDDARHYILTTDEKFDIITSDPIHPWVKGAACLYTREYFELVKKHLNKGGIVTQWVPLYESNSEVVKSEIKTFFEAFPYASVWLNDDTDGSGYDSILIGSNEPLTIDAGELQKQLDEHLLVSTLLKNVRFKSATDILASYAASREDLADWIKGGQTNHDADLRLQYLAGEALNRSDATPIRDEIVRRRTFPKEFINLSAEQRKALEAAWGTAGK